MRSSNNYRRRVRPQVECLENRQLLSVTAQASNGVLSIKGTSHADRIQINDDGNRISVFSGHLEIGHFDHINTIKLLAGAGADQVIYDVLGTSNPLGLGQFPGPALNRRLIGSLGDGADKFQLNVVHALKRPGVATSVESLGHNANLNILLTGGAGKDSASIHAKVLGANSRLSVRFDGNAGDDTFGAELGSLTAAEQPLAHLNLRYFGGTGNDQAFVHVLGDIATGATNFIDLRGEGDQDTLVARVDKGVMNGDLHVNVDGGAAVDQVFVDISMENFSDHGHVNATVQGGAGSDDLRLFVEKDNPASTTSVSARISGGTGQDTARFTNNVTVDADVETLVPSF